MKTTLLSLVMALSLTPALAQAQHHRATPAQRGYDNRGGHGGPGGPRHQPQTRYVRPQHGPQRVVTRHVSRPTVVLRTRPMWRPHLFGHHYMRVMPSTAVVFSVGPTRYYQYGGEYYMQMNNGYQLVAPPIGAWLAQLPPGAQMYQAAGINFATLNGSYFQWYPEYNAWQVVPPPGY